jgi:hypothetical protein
LRIEPGLRGSDEFSAAFSNLPSVSPEGSLERPAVKVSQLEESLCFLERRIAKAQTADGRLFLPWVDS